MKKFIVAMVAVLCMLSWSVEAQAEAVPERSLGSAVGYISTPGHKYYSVNGATLDFGLQDYIYNTLESYDMEWYFPTFLCQMYQESRFDQNCYTHHANGTVDVGLCQLKNIYHSEIKAIAGLPQETDLYSDAYANVLCGMALMRRNWTKCWDINTAISAYYTGSTNVYSATYVSDVRKWESTITEVK